MIITSRSAPKNWDCPKCHGHLWRNDSVRVVERRRLRPKHWWQRLFTTRWCSVKCPDQEHLHRNDRCGDCGTVLFRIEVIDG